MSRPIVILICAGAAALIAAACSGPSAGPTSPTAASATTGGGFTERMSSTLFGAPAGPSQNSTGTDNLECPTIDVRQGASTITIYGPGEPSATNVRYQATVGRLARECAKVGGNINMKVGLQGRIILGPAGGPGRLDVPIRFALVHEGPEPKTIWTKLYRVGVDVPAGQPNVPFVHVEENMTFPLPAAGELEAYVIYAGFDKVGAREQPRPRGRRARTSAR